MLQEYLARFSQLADDVMNCSAVLNWLEVSSGSDRDCKLSVGGRAVSSDQGLFTPIYTSLLCRETSAKVRYGLLSLLKALLHEAIFPATCLAANVARQVARNTCNTPFLQPATQH